jgi:hypothetical protein
MLRTRMAGVVRSVVVTALLAVAVACEKPNQWIWDAAEGPAVDRMDAARGAAEGGGASSGSGGSAGAQADGPEPPGGTGGAVACGPGMHSCSGTCLSSTSPESCGSSCERCPVVMGGEATCDGISCGGRCPTGTKLCLNRCVDMTEVCGQCPAGEHNCNGLCFANTSVAACGTSCTACVPPPGATPTCDGTSCGFTCTQGKKCGDRCGACCAAEDCAVQPGRTASCDRTSLECAYACPGGQKDCNGACIPESACCKDGDCPMMAGQVGKCDASTRMCGYSCAGTTKPCGGRCIPQDGCCDDSNCSGNFACQGNVCSTGTCRGGYKRCGAQCVPNAQCCEHEDCGACQECASGTCRNQAAGQDRKGECGGKGCNAGRCRACTPGEAATCSGSTHRKCNSSGSGYDTMNCPNGCRTDRPECLTCGNNQHVCDGQCRSDTSVDTCGSRCTRCPQPENATATCVNEQCSFNCNAGFMKSGSGCVPECGGEAQPCCAGEKCDGSNLACASSGAVDPAFYRCRPCGGRLEPCCRGTPKCRNEPEFLCETDRPPVHALCAPGCNPGQVLCNGQCTFLETDSQHCGRCGNACPTGQNCNFSMCGP